MALLFLHHYVLFPGYYNYDVILIRLFERLIENNLLDKFITCYGLKIIY